MAAPILSTKLYVPPVRPTLVSRPRLLRRLDASLDHKLTLVSAPAGFGKTTLLSEWIHRNAERGRVTDGEAASPIHPSPVPTHLSGVAWVSLDKEDNDPIRFWHYALVALRAIIPSIGETALAALQSPQPPSLDSIIVALINDIADLRTSLVLVLEDYHIIDTPQIHATLTLLLERSPPQFHLIITTRSDPPFSLSRHRARLELNEIRTADLRFNTEEAAEFLNACMGLNLSAGDVAALENRTEGWIVGLQMAALSLQKQVDKHGFVISFAGDDRYVADYLVEEVLEGQLPHVRTFLLQTSILERLCGPLCDAVTGREDGQVILNLLDEANLFVIPLDNQRQWYRYHHLFADLLRHRLRQLGPQLDCAPIEELHRRAGVWHEGEGFVAEAISHTLAIPDHEHAADLLEQHALVRFLHGKDVLIRSWLETIPEELIRSRPVLCVAQSWFTLLVPPQSPQIAERWLRDAQETVAAKLHNEGKPVRLDRDTRDLISGHIITLEAYLARIRGDTPQVVVDLSNQALNRLPKDDLVLRDFLFLNLGLAHLALGDVSAADHAFSKAHQTGEARDDFTIALAAIYIHAAIARRRGQLHRAAAICHRALKSIVTPAEQSGRPLLAAGSIYIAQGSILLERNELEGAKQALIRGLELVALTARPQMRIDGCVALARLRRTQGDIAEAFELIDQAESLWPGIGFYTDALRTQIRLSQAADDPSYLIAAIQWARARQLAQDEDEEIFAVHAPAEQHYTEQLALVRVRIAQHRAQGKPDMQPVLRFLDRQIDLAEKDGWAERTIELSILQALALQTQGDTPQALYSLARALVLAEPEGYIRLFVDEGLPMARLLYQAAEHGVMPEYAGKLLGAFQLRVSDTSVSGWDTPRVSLKPAPVKPETQLIEPLSAREVEVLHLIATGLTNREIAQELVISLSTIKVHTRNIYGKLGVRNRIQAVTQARALGILPST